MNHKITVSIMSTIASWLTKILVLVSGLIMMSPVAMAQPPVEAAPTAVIGQATTAKLTQIRGRVIINLGNTYQTAKPNAVVPTGAKIITVGQSSAVLIYEAGCSKEIKANSQLTVGNTEVCVGMPSNERVYVAEVTPPPLQSATIEAPAASFFVPVGVAITSAIIVLSNTSSSGSSNPDISPD